MWRYSACLSFPPRCSDRTSLVYMNTLSSSPLSASTVFVSPHPCSPVFIFYFPFYVLAGLHASVLLSPPIPISALSPPSLQLSLSFLSACPPICWSCPDNSAEGRSPPPPSHRPSLLMFPHSVAYQSDFFSPFLPTASLTLFSFPSTSLHFFHPSPSISLTKLSIHHASIRPANSSSPVPPNPVQTLQQRDQNVGEIEHEPR